MYSLEINLLTKHTLRVEVSQVMIINKCWSNQIKLFVLFCLFGQLITVMK